MKVPMKIAAIIATSVMLLSGCSRIETGEVGIVKHWNGEIRPTPARGVEYTVFDSVIAHVDTTETRYNINKLQPSDANGVLLEDLDIVISFRVDSEKVPLFYTQTKELDTYHDDSGREITTVGLKVIENIVQHSVQELTKQQSLVTLAANLVTYEAAILAQAQKELDTGYPGVFKLVRVNVNHFIPPASIREQANRTAALKGEAERNAEEAKLIEQRKQLEASKAALEAQALRAAMTATGLTAEQLIAWKNARAYEIQARGITGADVTKTVDVTKQPAGK
jgi:regulator of protease activity HflC (stomatin/prohibitin superfamily)